MPTAAEIESIVRVVVERLRGLQAAHLTASRKSNSIAVSSEKSTLTQPTSATTLSFENKLITLDLLRGKLLGIETVEVPNRAIVTPAVLDELRDRGVRLQRGEANCSKGTDSSKSLQRMLIVASQTKRVSPENCPTLSDNAGAESTVRSIAAHLADRRNMAIWCTPHPFAAMMASHGTRVIKAMSLPGLSEFGRAMTEASPNLLILDDHLWSAESLGQLARNWSERST